MIVAEYTTSSGVRVTVHDDYMAARGSMEEQRAIEEQRRAAHDILVGCATKTKGEAHERYEDGGCVSVLRRPVDYRPDKERNGSSVGAAKC